VRAARDIVAGAPHLLTAAATQDALPGHRLRRRLRAGHSLRRCALQGRASQRCLNPRSRACR
jgi:hypothetical protein